MDEQDLRIKNQRDPAAWQGYSNAVKGLEKRFDTSVGEQTF